MPKQTSKSSGIRMPVEIYEWIDRRAARRSMTRSQCVCDLIRHARRSLTLRPEAKQPWTVNAAKAGEYFAIGIILVDFQCMFGLL